MEDVKKALLSVEDLAALLGTSHNQVRNARRRGQLPPAMRLPGVGLRWRLEDVERWIAQHAKEVA